LNPSGIDMHWELTASPQRVQRKPSPPSPAQANVPSDTPPMSPPFMPASLDRRHCKIESA
jgi:hypothetical protein